jgi:hypothetical protein
MQLGLKENQGIQNTGIKDSQGNTIADNRRTETVSE